MKLEKLYYFNTFTLFVKSDSKSRSMIKSSYLTIKDDALGLFSFILCSVNISHKHRQIAIYVHTHSYNQTHLRNKGALVFLPYRQPHQRIPQLFHLLVVIQPLNLPLEVTW